MFDGAPILHDQARDEDSASVYVYIGIHEQTIRKWEARPEKGDGGQQC
jgi:hypothetical protein